jgi:predicted alpha/beta hydrolase family esterase
MPRVLILPGLYDSGPEHWQTRWEAEHPAFVRVRQRDWETPDRAEWVATLAAAIASSPEPAVLVAHWAAAHGGSRAPRVPRVKAALLVAPSDVEAPSYPAGPTGFAPTPLAPLPFSSIVVASTDDVYVSVQRAEHFAAAWGSRFEVVGALGHLNSASGLGSWPQGFALLQELLAEK